MNIPLGNYFSVSDVQRDYRKVLEKARRTNQPVVILRGNKPYVAVIDIKVWIEKEKKLEELEIETTLQAVEIARKERKEGKLKTLKAGDLVKLAGK
ncbi:MAG: type II toxin-antitoxin system prevent-host-death family antitoxin [Candidatus Daviesbacteria bacterium]|nr:type II toxin-antitoxin system prevent-host-death family antitoxin [Candidatus Daviesbacteria bacterium]